jgi:iron-sulfur cluster assembly protein
MTDMLSITPSARRRIDHLMTLADAGDDAIGIRIGVKNAGCSGMTYTMDFAKESGPHDEIIDVDGAKVVVEAAAVMFLIGTELDFKEEKLSATFVFNNPNATSTCGCGESFAVG